MNVTLTPLANYKTGIGELDYAHAAETLGCDVATIKAVDEVESSGAGFLKSGRPKILFEGHFFYRFLKALDTPQKTLDLHLKASKEMPDVCYKTWTTKFYLGGEREYTRLEKALKFCRDNKIPEAVALKSASWGRFQIMGANFAMCGFDNVYAFTNAIFTNETNHLKAFVSYIDSAQLEDELKNADWDNFAYGYNGPQYKRNDYHIKLRNAYKKYKEIEDSDELNSLDARLTVPELVKPQISGEIKPASSTDATHEPVKINYFTVALDKLKGVKQAVSMVLTGLGLSGTAVFTASQHIITNPIFLWSLGFIAVAGVVGAIVIGIIYFNQHMKMEAAKELEKIVTERVINIETLRIRASPDMQNVEMESRK